MELFKKKAAEYFEYYNDFIKNKSSRSTNELFTAAVSANDLLEKDTKGRIKKDLFNSNDFLVIKMLRNFNSHEGSVISDFKMTDDFATEQLKPKLGFCCLVSSKEYRAAKKGKGVKKTDIHKIDSSVSIIGDYIDIHPAIFNLSVYIFEMLNSLGLSLETKEYLMMKESYDKEKLHEIDHYITPTNYSNTFLSDGSSIENHIITFMISDEIINGLPDYNLMVGLDKPLNIKSIDFDDVAKNFSNYIKCVNGKPICYYDDFLKIFETLEQEKTLTSLKYLLSYNSQKFEKQIITVGSIIESLNNDEQRLKLLNFNQEAIFTFGNEKYITKYDYTYDFILYLSMIVNIQLHGIEHKEIKIMYNIINSKTTLEAAKNINKIRNNKKSLEKFRHLIFSQVVMLLIEFPFKEHQTKR